MKRCYYSSSISEFKKSDNVLQELTKQSEFDINLTQRNAWEEEISILKDLLQSYSNGQIIFEYDIPRLGRRVDVILLLNRIVFTIEFKAGEDTYNRNDLDQVWDYALDLKNFQEVQKHLQTRHLYSCL